MGEKAIHKKEIKEVAKELGKIIEGSSGIMEYNESVPLALKTMLDELLIPNEYRNVLMHKVMAQYR